MPPYEPWQPDPTGRHERRWRRKDGTWGNQVADGGVVSEDPYTGPQPDPDAPPAEQTAPDPSPRPAATPTPVAAAGREPLSFWGHAWATAVGVLLAGLVATITAAALLNEALKDWP